jgi:Transcriptional regulatory protein, C terminal
LAKKDVNQTIASGTNTLTVSQFDQVCRYINLHENIVIKLMPGGGKSSISPILENSETLKNVGFLALDCSLDIDSAQLIIKDYVASHTGHEAISSGLSSIMRDKILYFVLDNFTEDNEKLANYLLALRNSYGRNLKFIIVTNAYEYENLSANFKTKFSSLLHNVVEVHYFSTETASHWLEVVSKELGIEDLSASDKEYVLEICGGVPFLIKNFLRSSLYSNSLKETFNSNEFKDIVEIYWYKLAKQEQVVLKTLHYQKTLINLPKTTDHLVRFGLIVDGKINGRWIELIKEIGNPKFTIEGKRIFWDEVDFTKSFTENEVQILIELVNKDGEILDRDDIAKIIWGEHASSEYSAWAIDQNISRLRKRLEEVGIPKDTIVTIKKKGVKLAD